MIKWMKDLLFGTTSADDEEAVSSVPKNVRDASHDLQNAVMRARYHIRKAERELEPDRIENFIKELRETGGLPDE